MTTDLIPIEAIQHRILVLRGSKVLIDNDLAVLYGVSTKRLNEQVKRNADRFPDDFMFQKKSNRLPSLPPISHEGWQSVYRAELPCTLFFPIMVR